MSQGCLRRGPSCGPVNSSLGVLLTQVWRLQGLADSVLDSRSGTRVVPAQSCCVTWVGRRGGGEAGRGRPFPALYLSLPSCTQKGWISDV